MCCQLKQGRSNETRLVHLYQAVLCYPELTSTASLLAGGMIKQIDGTVASFPLEFRTFQLCNWELFTRTHSSPLCTVIWVKRMKVIMQGLICITFCSVT